MARLPPRPNFLIIGMRHCATRWLRFNLSLHPEICAPPVSTDFYVDTDRMARLGLRWFREQFRDWDGEPFLGEAVPSYTNADLAPREIAIRVSKHLPGVRLIAIVGHPVERFRAEFRRLVRWGEIPADTDPEAFYQLQVEHATALRTISAGIQSPGLLHFRDRFGDALKMLTLDDVVARPEAVYAEVLQHIGADPTFVPPDLATPRFADDELFVEAPPPAVATRQQLYEWFRPDVRRIEMILERDLSHWDPGSDLVTYSPEFVLRQVFGHPDPSVPAS